jgi:hypothetical protein
MTDDRRPVGRPIRSERTPDDAVVVVRGGPIAADKIVEHARRQEALFTFRERPMMAISVDLTVAGWTLGSDPRSADAHSDQLRHGNG